MRMNQRTKFKETLELNDDHTIATLTYKFRGLAEAEAFQILIRNVLRLSGEYFDEAKDMDDFCKLHNCEDF